MSVHHWRPWTTNPGGRRRLPGALLLVFCVGAGCTDRAAELSALETQAEAALRDTETEHALTLARDGRRLATGDLAPAWADRFRLLEAAALVQARQSEAAAALLATPVAPGPARAALDSRREFLLAQLETRRKSGQGKLAEVVPLLADLSARATLAGALPTALDADLLRAQVLAIERDLPAAETLLREVRRRAAAAGDAHREAAALNNLGMSRFGVSRYDEALEFLKPILALSSLERTGLYAGALNNAGICFARLGDFDQAVTLQRRAIAAESTPVYHSRALGELGNTLILSGDPAGAVTYLEQALTAAKGAGLLPDAALWAGNLAVASLVLERWDAAERYNLEAIQLSAAQKLGSTIYTDHNAARIAAGRGQKADARRRLTEILATRDLPPAVEWEAHADLAGVLLTTDTAEAIREFDRALQVIERTRADLLKTEYRFAFPSRLRHFTEDYVDALIALGQDEAALEVADASKAQVLAERPGVATPGPRPKTAAFRALARRSGATFVAYWLGRDRSHAWVVSGSGTVRVDLPPAAAIRVLAKRYRTEVEQSLANPITAPSTSGEALAAAVLLPVARLLPPRATVVIVADDVLHDINFEMLPVGSPRRFWIRDVTIEVAPSVGILAAGRAVAGGPRAGGPRASALLVGDPVPPSPELAPLAHAGAELTAVAATLGGRALTVRSREAATPASYLGGDPRRFSIIHFAAHATVSAASPLDSSIELSADAAGSFKLYARDVAGLPLDADLVTISACRSAAARAYASEGLVGFAWAFQRAGARRVVAGLWDVDDRSTAGLMTTFYERLAAGDAPARALRSAKLRMLDAGGSYAKPYYWAPFQLFTAVPPDRPSR